jgi:hypothetical protein
VTPQEYVEQQQAAFIKTCEDMGFTYKWDGGFADMKMLDEARDLLWADGAEEALGDAVAIMWAAHFSTLVAAAYISRWAVDPESRTPVLIGKCGNRGLQLKIVLVVAQAFNQGRKFTEVWAEMETMLDEAKAEKV